MNILITGINGFVGSNLAKFLKRSNHIIGVGTRRESVLKDIEYFVWDISKDNYPKEMLDSKIDVIIHAAACLTGEDTDENLILTNCLGTHKIYELAEVAKVNRVYYISSIPVIGIPKYHPITEEHPLAPNTMYHATKLSGEFILGQLEKKAVEVVNLRIPSPIAPGMPEKTILPIFLRRALENQKIMIFGKGTRAQMYLDLRDLAVLIENSLGMNNISGTYNIAPDKCISNLELAKLCIEIANSNAVIEFENKEDVLDNQIWDVSNGKAKLILGYIPKTSIEKSIRDIMTSMN